MQPRDPRSDEALVEAVARGDAGAFEVLYWRYRDFVYQLAWRSCGDRHEALDVLQETFAHLYTRFPAFRLRARMTTYLYPVVRHIARDRRRARVRATGEEAGELVGPLEPRDPSEPSPEESRAEIEAVLAPLGPGHREVLLLRFCDDLELAAIAEALEIPLGTVKSRLHNALAALRDDPRTRRLFPDGSP